MSLADIRRILAFRDEGAAPWSVPYSLHPPFCEDHPLFRAPKRSCLQAQRALPSGLPRDRRSREHRWPQRLSCPERSLDRLSA
ncbi:MAG: hypothetical protein ACRDGN_03615 [bacterium]